LAVLSTICFAVAMIRFKPATESEAPRPLGGELHSH
jgi:hypothetical protein